MNMLDSAGYPISGANSRSLEAFEAAAHELRCCIGDPVAMIDAAVALSSAAIGPRRSRRCSTRSVRG